eukprot:COSAG05_NODE_1884_length_3893_cov_3.355825_7_plen_106_part_00
MTAGIPYAIQPHRFLLSPMTLLLSRLCAGEAAKAVEEQLQDMRAALGRGSPRESPAGRGLTTRAEDIATVARYWHGLQDVRRAHPFLPPTRIEIWRFSAYIYIIL